MKKLLLSLAVSLALFGCDGIGADMSNKSHKTAEYEYEIDTWGSNTEVYEFTPKSNADKTCVFVMLDSGAAMGLQCFDKKEVNLLPSKNSDVPR